MAIHRVTITPGQKPTAEQLAEIRALKDKPIVFDDDAPELTPEQYAEFAAIAKIARAKRQKKVVSLRLDDATLAKARLLGRGYTGILSRLVSLAIDDPEMVRKCL